MALDARKRQKKAEKRNAKQKAKRQELSRRAAQGLGERLARTAAAPILHCFTTQSLWDEGISQVLVSRELASGQVAFAAFLIDRYCLGVKDGFCGFAPRSDYLENAYEKIKATGDVVLLKPAAARKLVEDAEAYARSIGFAPYADYRNSKQIFGNIDPAQSDRTFEFGRDGKPLFISGPFDTPARCKAVVDTLTLTCGPGNFDYLVHVTGGAPDSGGMVRLSRALVGGTLPGNWEEIDGDDVYFDEDEEADVEDDSDDVIEGTVHPQPDARRRGWSLFRWT